MARIVVCGYMIRFPLAGNMLAYFHYLLGLHRLGHQVVYVEESGWPYSCYEPTTGDWRDHPATGLRLVRELMAEHDAVLPFSYVNRNTGATEGMSRAELENFLARADLLLNVGGVCWLPEFRLCRRRALIDLDPLFTQVDQFGAKLLGDYDAHFSYGTQIGRPGCSLPMAGVTWQPMLPPVVPELWHRTPRTSAPNSRRPLTTIANWGAYGGIEYGGEQYGQKDVEFLRLIDLPQHTAQPLELALSGAGEETVAQFVNAGWSVRDAGLEVSTGLEAYQAYIRNSRGEFSAAKQAYVKTRSGWFSDRSVCYLAAGLPVILQDTGFSDLLPTGRGLLAFSTVEEAADCIERVNADYLAHCASARDLAEDILSYRVVLPRLLDAALAESTASPPSGEGLACS
jgi:hypothetical protein